MVLLLDERSVHFQTWSTSLRAVGIDISKECPIPIALGGKRSVLEAPLDPTKLYEL